MVVMKALSLFSGIGGLDLSAIWAGVQVLAHSEIDTFCSKVLAKHWPNTPNLGGIHNVTAASLISRGIDPDDIDAIFGGFPCQPLSFAGKRLGAEDDRYLWPQMFRVVTQIRPAFILGENVAGIVSMGLDGILSDLEGQGYTSRTFIIPALSVQAQHKRDRVAIVAYSRQEYERLQQIRQSERQNTPVSKNDGKAESLAYANSQRQQECDASTIGGSEGLAAWTVTKDGRMWEFEPDVDRVVNGFPGKLDRNRGRRIGALGNAVVPQQFFPIFEAVVAMHNNLLSEIGLEEDETDEDDFPDIEYVWPDTHPDIDLDYDDFEY